MLPVLKLKLRTGRCRQCRQYLATASIGIAFSRPSSRRASADSVQHGAVPTVVSASIRDGLQQVFVCRGPPAQPPDLWLAAASNHSSVASMSAHRDVCPVFRRIIGTVHYTELPSEMAPADTHSSYCQNHRPLGR